MLDILAITCPIYLVIALGYGCTRQGIFQSSDLKAFGKFTINLALPALLFTNVSERALTEILNPPYMLAYGAGCLVMALAGLWWGQHLKGASLSYSSMLAMGMSCPNSGFVGDPILLMMLGPVAGVCLALNVMVEVMVVIPLLLAVADHQQGATGHWTQGVQKTLWGLMRNPLMLSIAAGAAFSLGGGEMPPFLMRTVHLFAQATAVLALFVIGGSLVGLRLQGQRSTVSLIAFAKLVVHPLVVAGLVAWLLPVADPTMRIAVVLSSAMPMMGIYTILSQRHGHEAISAAALLVTTVASFFTVNGLLWVLHSVNA